MFEEKITINKTDKIFWRDPKRKFINKRISFYRPVGFSMFFINNDGILEQIVDFNKPRRSKDFYLSNGTCELYCLSDNAYIDVKFGDKLNIRLKNREYTNLEHEIGMSGNVKLSISNSRAFVKKYHEKVKNDDVDISIIIQDELRETCVQELKELIGREAYNNNYSEDFLYENKSLELIKESFIKSINDIIDTSGMAIYSMTFQLNKIDEYGEKINDARLDSILKEINRN